MIQNSSTLDLEMKDTRSGFGVALTELGRENNRVVALCADLMGSLKMDDFAKNHPDRFFQMGISEANMIGVAAGLAGENFIPFVGSFANFVTGRVYDQLRQSVAYSQRNVKIAASHAGLTLGEDGGSHQILEDIGLMKMLPGMMVVNPCDYYQTILATKASAKHIGPVYLRFGRPKWPVFTSLQTPFELGKGILFEKGQSILVIATGHLLWEALEAYRTLAKEGIQVSILNIHTIKPLDEEGIIKLAKESKGVIVAEEHNFWGGLGESVARILSQHCPILMDFVAVQDTFGESGTPKDLMKKYHITAEHIYHKVQKMINKIG